MIFGFVSVMVVLFRFVFIFVEKDSKIGTQKICFFFLWNAFSADFLTRMPLAVFDPSSNSKKFFSKKNSGSPKTKNSPLKQNNKQQTTNNKQQTTNNNKQQQTTTNNTTCNSKLFLSPPSTTSSTLSPPNSATSSPLEWEETPHKKKQNSILPPLPSLFENLSRESPPTPLVPSNVLLLLLYISTE